MGGTHRESVVSEAFKQLLKDWAKSANLMLVPQYPFKTKAKDHRSADGAILYEDIRLPSGY